MDTILRMTFRQVKLFTDAAQARLKAMHGSTKGGRDRGHSPFEM
jgi:hypothetical protein